MASQWYCKSGESKLGPMGAAALRKLVSEGSLNPTDYVRKGADGKWVRAKTVKGLFPAEPTPAPEKQNDSVSKRSHLLWPGVRLCCGIVLLVFGLYHLFFGGVIWPIRESFLGSGLGETIYFEYERWASPTMKLITYGCLVGALVLVIPAGWKMHTEFRRK